MGIGQSQGSRIGVRFFDMHDIFFDRSENPGEHIKKMDSDIGGNPARLFFISLPTDKVPVAPAGQVSQINGIHAVRITRQFRGDFFPEGDYAGVQAKLQNCVDIFAAFLFQLGQAVNIPRVEY